MTLMCRLPLWGLEGRVGLWTPVVEGLSSKIRLHAVGKFRDLGETGRSELIGQLSRSREWEKSRRLWNQSVWNLFHSLAL